MKALLYKLVGYMALVHEKILAMNDSYEVNFTDKQLHFLVIGIMGMLMVFALHPLFLWLAKKDHVLTITWLYVFTVILVITFAIEIGQRVTNTGVMEFSDIVFGMGGFLWMFAIFWAIRLIIKGILKLVRMSKEKSKAE